MSAEQMIATLLRVAYEDLDGARVLAKAANRNAAYLCEQAAEKVIRAVLTAEAMHAGIKHQLDAMVDLLPDENSLKPALRSIEYLAAYATSFRYPTPTGKVPKAPGPGELQTAIDRVAVVLAEASRVFEVDLADGGKPAGRPEPPRSRQNAPP
jgi:HEPN domain-containing protein